MDFRGMTTDALHAEKEQVQTVLSKYGNVLDGLADLAYDLSQEIVMRKWIADFMSEAATPYQDIDEEGMDAEEGFDSYSYYQSLCTNGGWL